MRGWNSSNSVSLKWTMEYGPIAGSGLASLVYFAYEVIASKGIVLTQIGVLPGQIGCLAGSSRGHSFLIKGWSLGPTLWALYQGYLALGGWQGISSYC